MNIDSFIKGEQFERFVETNLFVETDYVLIHRTNSYNQNKDRFAENTMKPDFKFRCKKTLKEFYIEAKYRSSFNVNDKIEVITFQQLERFRKIQSSEDIRIFIVVGYEGYASSPKYLSLIPLDELLYLELYPSFLRNYNVERLAINSNSLKLNYEVNNNDADGIKFVKYNSKNKSRIIIGSLLVAIISLIAFYSFYENTESTLKRKTAEYYEHIENGNIDALENYIAPKVDNWYNKSNLTYDQIITETTEYLNKFPKSTTDIRWDTFEIKELGNDYHCTYKLVYKIMSKGKLKDKVYHLKIRATWGEDHKLKSITEERL